jgi:2-polyprenyl-3-methyl-5-hydroxy-6-metoxy-1,4-benzoquinol methylase
VVEDRQTGARTAGEDADLVTSSDAYARRFSGAVGRFFLDVQEAATLELLRPFPAARILDVGGGHGQLTGALVDAGFDVTVLGSDRACEKRVAEWTVAGSARFIAADLIEPGLAERSFDVVLSYRLLPHVRRWRELVRTLARLARLAVVVDYPTRRSVNAVGELLFGLKKGVEKDTRPFTVFSDHEIASEFAANGFAATGRRAQFLFPMALHRAAGSARLARTLEGAAKTGGLTGLFGSPVILRLERRG